MPNNCVCCDPCCPGRNIWPECITLDLLVTCCDPPEVSVQLCRNFGPPVNCLPDGSYRYTGVLPTDWCESDLSLLNAVSVGIVCIVDEITNEAQWYICMNDSGTPLHTWHPDPAYLYPLTLISCNPILFEFGGLAGCSGKCQWLSVPACFSRGTLVSTPDGDRIIESLRKGDRVFDINMDIVEVTDIRERLVTQVVLLTDESGIVTGVTPEHPFMIDSEMSIPAGDLTEQTLLPNGKKIKSTSLKNGVETVVNLSVSGTHTFIANGFMVHNK